MASPQESVSMALFCDFENVALGVRDANYEKFDIKRVLERLLLKGSIVVKKAYCDWERYKGFKAVMHEANFELIEIPHVRQSGKNSADIRLVVDALDLCYTKSHVNTFVIISGDSDFSPLVSKLRENAKQVIGVGVKQSTSDLLIANCDEFIFYDDLVREDQRKSKRAQRDAQPQARRSPDEETQRRDELEARRTKAVEIAVETFEALLEERGDSGKIWSSVLKEAIKRRKPDFNESYFGFRAFGNLLEEAQARGLLAIARDEKSNTYVYRSREPLPGAGEETEELPLETEAAGLTAAPAPDAEKPAKTRGRRKGGRKEEGGKKERPREGGAQAAPAAVDEARAGEGGGSAEATAAPTEAAASTEAAAPSVSGAGAMDAGAMDAGAMDAGAMDAGASVPAATQADVPAPRADEAGTAAAAGAEARKRQPKAVEPAPAVAEGAAVELPAESDKPARKRSPRKKKAEGEAAGAAASASARPATSATRETDAGGTEPPPKSTARTRRPRKKEETGAAVESAKGD